ncbi:hypothetical protein [Pelagirhabdus alkalitolerans]|uniref:hypothetical protein n=1 Tax=Pelagirhabdus alkalitolerans TaxID=1612202 RepID=UPI000B85EDFB|nr:hypothetical protein [Pelagirhabdus alkalitolerans]
MNRPKTEHALILVGFFITVFCTEIFVEIKKKEHAAFIRSVRVIDHSLAAGTASTNLGKKVTFLSGFSARAFPAGVSLSSHI